MDIGICDSRSNVPNLLTVIKVRKQITIAKMLTVINWLVVISFSGEAESFLLIKNMKSDFNINMTNASHAAF